MSERGILLRLLASIGALALGAIAVVIVSVLAHDTPGPASSATVPLAPASPAATDTTPTTTSASATTPSLPPAKTAFPAPPNGAVVFFRPNGNQVVALGVVPGNQLKLQTSVLSGEGKGVPGLGVSYRVGSKQATATPCGDGCYVATVASPNAPKAVDVRITGE